MDAAFFSELKVARLGIVVRDSRGEVLWCAMEKVTMVYSPLQAELMAILFGIHEMTGSPFQDIEVESDSLLAINEVENTNQSLCAWEGISMDIRRCAQDFRNCKFSFICRDSNVLAHRIASMTNVADAYKVWRQTLPQSSCNPDTVG